MPTLLEERPVTREMPAPEVTVRVVGEDARRAPRRPRRFSLIGTIAVGALAVAVFVAAGAITGLIDIGNPFGTTTTDNSGPVLLKRLTNLSEYRAAQGHFAETIDLEHSHGFLPEFIAGDSTIFMAVGTVDATIDFSHLPTDAVQVASDRAVTITLPAPKLDEPVVDADKSHVADRNRGLLDRIGSMFSDNPTSEKPLYQLAEKKFTKAARESHLVSRAETNTTKMLTGLLNRLGYSDVHVAYVRAPKKGSV